MTDYKKENPCDLCSGEYKGKPLYVYHGHRQCPKRLPEAKPSLTSHWGLSWWSSFHHPGKWPNFTVPLFVFMMLGACAPGVLTVETCFGWDLYLRPVGAVDGSKDVEVYGFQTHERFYDDLAVALSFGLEQAGGDPGEWRFRFVQSFRTSDCGNVVETGVPFFENGRLTDDECHDAGIFLETNGKPWSIGPVQADADDLIGILSLLEGEVEDRFRGEHEYELVWPYNDHVCYDP